MDRANGTDTVNTGVQTEDVGGIKEQIIKHLVNSGDIGKYKIRHVSLGKTALDKNNAVVLSWQDRGKDITALQQKISEKPNGDLKYTSPIEIFDSNDEAVKSNKDGILFYIAVKFRKDQNRIVEEEENDLESDSGMGDSGQSQNGDPPDTEDRKWNVSQEARHGKNDVLRLNEKMRNAKNRQTTIHETNIEDIKINSEISEVRKIFLSRQELRRRYTRIKRNKKTKEKTSSEPGKRLDKPMWLAANVNSFNANFKGRPCYSFHCLPRIRKK